MRQTTKCNEKVVWNRLYYKGEDGTIYEGKIICYDHDEEKCKKCDRCPDHQLCEVCWKDITNHTEKQKDTCMLRMGEEVRNLKGFISAVEHIRQNQFVYKTILLDGEVIHKRECRFD